MSWLLYGAYGYTGTLIAEAAVRAGLRPVLAGRDGNELAQLGARLGLPMRPFGLDDENVILHAIKDVGLVYNAAGPFSHTARPLIDACLRAGVSYVDITGEASIIEGTLARDREARARGILLCSGAGFDVVPSDNLAAYLKQALPSAERIEIAIATLGRPSPGTLKSVLEMLPRGGLVQRAGKLVSAPFPDAGREVRFSDRSRHVVTAPLGDLISAAKTTGVADVELALALPRRSVRRLRLALPLMRRVLRSPRGLRIGQALVGRFAKAADAGERARGGSYLYGRATSASGQIREAWLDTLEGYTFTAEVAPHLVTRYFAQRPVGGLTPSQAFGMDLALALPGTVRRDALA